MDIETILKRYFGCKNPFLKNPKRIPESETVGEYEEFEYMTKAGICAYNKLVGVVYSLEEIGLINNANALVDRLDAIVDSETE